MTDSALHGLTLPDGGCRDINLFGVLPDGAHRLVTWLHAQFESRVCKAYESNSEVEPFDPADFRRPLDAGDSIWGVLNGGSALFDHLQYFVAPTVDGEWFVELTFFPDDLHLDGTVDPLEAWIREALKVAGAHQTIVRFENASFDPAWDRRFEPEVLLFINREGDEAAP